VRSRAASEWAKIYPDVRADPLYLCKLFNFEPTWQQRDVIRIVQRESQLPPHRRLKRIAVKSGQGPGKTALSVILLNWRVLLGVDALGIVTAPTMVQAKDVWLGTCRKMMNKAHPLLRAFIKPTKSRVLIGGNDHPDWSIQLMAASRPENTQGRHDKYLTFLEEEASGIEDEIDEQIKGTLTNENSLLIKIGNPNFRDVHFFDAFNTQRDEYHTYTMNAEESPIVDQENVKKIAKEYGKDSDVYRVRVLGEFPSENPNSVLSSDDLEACARLDPVIWAKKSPTFKQFGFDLARYGGDENVVYQRSGQAIIDSKIKRGCEPVDILRAGMHMERVCGWFGDKTVRWVLDADGIGQGTLHVAYEGSKSVVEFHSASTKVHDKQFANQLSEAWWHTRELVRPREIAIPNDSVLIKQLCDRHYALNNKGQVQVESKKEYLRRKGLSEGSGNSPDRADAFVMANYRFGITPGRSARGRGSGKKIGPRIRR
jgi:hypothetical protein